MSSAELYSAVDMLASENEQLAVSRMELRQLAAELLLAVAHAAYPVSGLPPALAGSSDTVQAAETLARAVTADREQRVIWVS